MMRPVKVVKALSLVGLEGAEVLEGDDGSDEGSDAGVEALEGATFAGVKTFADALKVDAFSFIKSILLMVAFSDP